MDKAHCFSTRERIVQKLQSTDDPAISAAKLAEELEVSVCTINNHVDDLVENGRVQSLRIENATAYYIPASQQADYLKPDFYCARCGRSIDSIYDFAKVECDRNFLNEGEDPTGDFHIFCRFCFKDFNNWMNKPKSCMEYPFIDEWDIPEDQRQEVKSDPEIVTEPSSDLKDLG